MALTEPDSGEVRIGGKPWTSLKEPQRRPLRSEIQLITQDTLGVFDPRYSVADSLREAILAARKIERDGVDAQIGRLCGAVRLARQHLPKRLRQMSGGERQRVAFGRALVTRPRVLICDEPVSALDVSIQAQILDLLMDIQAREKLSILFISHDLGVVHHVSDRVIVLRDGEVVETGIAAAIFHSPRHPYLVELVAAIQHFSAAPSAAAE